MAASPAKADAEPSRTDVAQVSPAWAQRVAGVTGIPQRAVLAYAAADLALRTDKPSCRIGWNTLAAIERWNPAMAAMTARCWTRPAGPSRRSAGLDWTAGTLRGSPTATRAASTATPVGSRGRADAVPAVDLAHVGTRRQW